MYAVVPYLAFLSVTGSFLNLLVCVVLLKDMRRMRVQDIFLVSISTGDFLASSVAIPIALKAALSSSWPFGLSGCQVHAFLIYTLGLVSITNLAALALEKFLTIVKCLYSDEHFFTRLQAICVVAGLWVYCLLITIPPLFGWARYGLEPGNKTCSLRWDDDGPADDAYYGVMFGGYFILPLALMVFSYFRIFKVECHDRQCKKWQLSHNKRALLRKHIQSAVFFLLLIAGYLMAWTPYTIATLSMVSGAKVSDNGLMIPSLFAKTSFVLNPILYTLVSKRFR
ncbi:predicted protein, partial [Nematostella vectensis]